MLAVAAIEINLSLFFFNLFPIPPLDGSHLVRNMLPYNAIQAYDRIGNSWISWLLMIFVGGYILRLLLLPTFGFVLFLLARF
jgi:Zn-dependent protease